MVPPFAEFYIIVIIIVVVVIGGVDSVDKSPSIENTNFLKKILV